MDEDFAVDNNSKRLVQEIVQLKTMYFIKSWLSISIVKNRKLS